jgi:putative ABC transport system ATP-binding protein
MSDLLINIKNISLRFPGVERDILSELTYEVYENDFIIVLGSNGSGKSSLIKLLDKRYVATQGDIFLSERLLEDYRNKEFHHAVKTLTQNADESLFTSLSVLENYLLAKQQQQTNLLTIRHKNERLFLAEYLQPFNPNLASKLDMTVDKLSGGEKQSLALALTVLYPPKVLLLDEHTSALDPKTANSIMLLTQKIIQKFNITCILTTHDLEIAEHFGNRILALKQGKIYQKFDQELKDSTTRHDLLAACY